MQIELTLTAPEGADYAAHDLGFLLHKHPGHVHSRETAQGVVTILFPETGGTRTRAVIHLAVDPVALVRGKGESEGMLDQYVNDRPYAANSLLSVALARAIGQTLAGKSKERQALADRPLPWELRIVPVAVAGGLAVVEELFLPLGYQIDARPLDTSGHRAIFDLRLQSNARLADILTHVQVLVPVMDNAKHYFVDKAEIDKLLAKGGNWLPKHPAKELIARRALKHRPSLVEAALERLDEALPEDDTPPPEPEEALEAKVRLHDLRLDAVRDMIVGAGARSVLDLGCGEGRLLRRLVREKGVDRIVGVDPSVRTLEMAARRLHLADAGEALRKRLMLQMGSLTYGDRRWAGFDAATLVEVIEHIDAPRLPALELSLFGMAKPGLVIVTTPNRDYNVLFEGLPSGKLRHGDHRFEWTRAEFAAWAGRVAATYGYRAEITPLGPLDDTHGAPSQMAVFTREGA
jgi:3' terminal RNA ribose 2'-O-methyltransferase Hen1